MAAESPPLQRTALFGAGRMGSALLAGWMRNPAQAGLSQLDVIEPSPSEFVAKAGGDGYFRLNREPEPVDVVIVAVKPQAYAGVEGAVSEWVGRDALVVSIMAGVPIDRMRSGLGVERIVRAMPNTPGAVGQGVTAYSISSACSEADRMATERLLSPLGAIVGPLPEAQMDAVTAVSGSGPAYVFLLAECLEGAARSAGLDEQIAKVLAHRTVIGAGALLAGGDEPAKLREAVTSPGGTTAAALEVFMKDDRLKALVREAVEAAAARSRNLSKPS